MSQRLILLLALVACAALTLSACNGSPSAAASSPLNVTISASEFKYDPNTINASPGQTINLTVKNVGSVQHTWVLDQANVKLTIDPGQTVSKTFAVPSTPGTNQFYCDVAGHKEAGMVGQLIVK